MPRLRRTFPDQPGWTRRRSGKGFIYLDEAGRKLDAEQVQRCKALVIPPAWRDVWITPHPNGHLQAVGTDDAGRKQYLYHPQWRASRDAAKFDRILGFGKALSKARERVLSDIGAETMSLERACAVAVRLLDLGYFRIGNDVYTDTNGSFGLTTLRKEAEREHRQAGYLTTAADTERRRLEWVQSELVKAGTERARSLGWTDVYTFAKAMGEAVVADMGKSLAFYRRLGLDIPDSADAEPHVEAALEHTARKAA